MSAITVGGAPISEASITYSWGLSPGSASVKVPGSVLIGVGSDAVIGLGGRTFYGIVANNPVETRGLEGTTTTIALVDNRIKLMWDDVYATFNNSEVRESIEATRAGIGRQKRFWHILPEDWDSQTRTWADAPMSAREIIASLFAAPTLRYTWLPTFHLAQSKPVYEIDCNNGAKLGTVLQEITEQQGLVFTIGGTNQLIWTRKGDGVLPAVPSDSRSQYSLGESLSPNATSVRIVGDRNRYQDMPIDLVADWLTAYEAFWIEPLWLAEVETRFGPFTTDASGRATLAAKARSVTVRDYAAKVGDPDGSYTDAGRWGEVARMEIPVWTYLQDIVFKAYRVPSSYTVNGITLDSLQLVEGLLAAVDYDETTGDIALKNPREFYPDSKAFILVKGQPVDFLDPHTQNLSKAQLDSAKDLWTPCNKFNLDVKNNAVIFEHAVFVPGDGDNGLFLFPNQDVDGVTTAHPLYNICAPNSNVTTTHASVRAVLSFEAEKYSKRYGSGTRRSPQFVRSLNYHALMLGGVFTEEVKYADGKSADEKASEFSQALIAQAATYASGGYNRVGASGTSLSGVVDRVTVTLTMDAGLTERVDFTKERAQDRFEPERELERRARSKDLFPGQKANNAAVTQLQAIAKISKELKRGVNAGYANIAQIHQKPVGAAECSMATFDTTDTWQAGQPVFLDETTHLPAADGKVFGGIVISEGATGKGVAAATQGTVPVRVRGPFNSGDPVGIDSGSGQTARVGGANLLGTVNATYTGSDVVLAPVRLGTAGTPADTSPWLPILSEWKGTGTDPHVADRKKRFRLCRGEVNSHPATNVSDEFVAFGDIDDADIEEEDAVVTYIYGRIPTSETSLGQGDLAVGRPTLYTVEGEVDDDLSDLITAPPGPGSDGSLPAYIVVGLRQVSWWGGKLHIEPGQGVKNNLWVSLANGSAGCDKVARNFIVNAV